LTGRARNAAGGSFIAADAASIAGQTR
jgi:hypothetical protein